MKYLSVILSLYILVLSLFPCGDRIECKDDARLSASLSAFHHGDHDHQTESCSPFCVCACCGQLVNLDVASTFELKTFFASGKVIIPSSDEDLKEHFYSIWQPPKLG